MPKYIIKVQDLKEGTMYLVAMDYDFYLFLNDEHLPSDEAKTHIEETYSGKIDNSSTFGYYRIMNNKKVYIEGWGLKRHGKPYHWDSYYTYFPMKEFKEKCNEIIQSVREFETIIEVGLDYTDTSRLQAGWAYETNGYFSINMNFKLFRKSPVLNPQGYRDAPTHDYFSIPEGEDVETYIPIVSDKSGLHVATTYREIPYSKERLNTLKMICATGDKLGKELKDLFENKSLELEQNNQMSFLIENVDKTNT